MERSIITSPFILQRWLFTLPIPKVLSIDCETTDLKYTKLDIVGWSMCDGKRACYVDVRNKYRDRLLGLLKYYLSEFDPLVIFHNAPYDIMVLRKVGVI